MKAKWCWLAKEYAKGWRLGLCVGNEPTRWLQFWFAMKDIAKIVCQGKTVYVHMKKAA